MELLDAHLPGYDFSSHHELAVAAPPERTLAALMALNSRDLRLTRLLMGLRRIPARLRGKPAAVPAPTESGDRGMVPAAFVELARTDRAAAYGLAAQFWKPVAPPVKLADAAAFEAFHEPGYAKAVMGFEVRPTAEGCRLLTETRIAVTDGAARRSFSRYWLVIRAGSGLIRREVLHAVRLRAERG
ncbi:MAG: hypothetical protein QOI98_2502 [Solirubrobacteraceae bacterium]|nr:hypothetical protein [Solirubrobacteraceae bacterium]